LTQKKNIYFASDLHLGFPDPEESLIREKIFVRWLDEIKQDAGELYLLGDIFDFWFEYKRAVPRGYTRLLGKIAEFTDSGIPVHFFTGNHDIWVFGYLEKEVGVILHKEPYIMEYNGKKFYLAHGDGLGPYDTGFKFIRKIFHSPFFQWLFARIHPNAGIGIAHYWSLKSRRRKARRTGEYEFRGEDGEWLITFSKDLLKKEHYDYMIFGHRHVPIDFKLSEKSRHINLGDWIFNFSYAVFNGEDVELKKYETGMSREDILSKYRLKR